MSDKFFLGPNKFIRHQDAPDEKSYAGQAGKVVLVNSTEDGFEFGAAFDETAHDADDHSGLLPLDHTNAGDLINVGTNTHAQIDTHIASTANPHTTSDANLSVTDITTNNVSTSKHGFAPKAPNDATKYLDGTGAYSIPAGGSATPGGADTQVQFNDSGSFGGDAGLVYDKTNNILSIVDGKHQIKGLLVGHSFTTHLSADIAGRYLIAWTANGGIAFQGFTDADKTAFEFQGHVGVASPTQAACIVRGYKLNGTARTDMTGTQIPLDIYAGDTTRLVRFTANGNVLIGSSIAAGASATGTIVLQNGTAPSSSPANGVQLYAEDVSSSSELKVRDEAGNVTTLSPHSGDVLDSMSVDSDHQVPFIYKSKNIYLGKEIIVDLELLARKVQELSGVQIVTVNNLPPEEIQDWDTNQEVIRLAVETERAIALNSINEIDTLISLEQNPEIIAALELEKQRITVPDSYIKKPVPTWIAQRLN